MTHTDAEVKVEGQSVQKLECKQVDGQWTDMTDCHVLLVNVVGKVISSLQQVLTVNVVCRILIWLNVFSL